MTYTDKIGQELTEGDYVAGMQSSRATPEIYKVTGFTPKKVRLENIADEDAKALRFPKELFKIDSAQFEKFVLEPVKDAIGQVINVGDYVIGNDGEYIDLVLFRVTGFVKGQLTVEAQGSVGYGAHRINIWFGHDVIKVADPQLITMYLLKGED